MASKSTTVTIPLEEYKALLLKDKPITGNAGEMLERIFTILEAHLSYDDRDYDYNDTVMKNVRIKGSDLVIKEVFNMVKYLDFDRYMRVWNNVMNAERERKVNEEKIKQMNAAKELRAETRTEGN